MGRTVQWFGGPRDGETFTVPGGTKLVALDEVFNGEEYHWLAPIRGDRVMWGEKREAPEGV